jgi:hypothetical protein
VQGFFQDAETAVEAEPSGRSRGAITRAGILTSAIPFWRSRGRVASNGSGLLAPRGEIVERLTAEQQGKGPGE